MNENTKKKGKGKIIAVLLITLLLAGGGAFGGFILWQNAGYLTTDNARVTTTLLHVAPTMHGNLERFEAYEGRRVSANEVLGWVENDAVMRSPVDGMIVHISAQTGHTVSPMESVATIADANNIHILANIEETDIMELQLGQPAIVTIDVFGNREFTGYISEIGRITGAELSGQAVFFNTGGNFTRVTHLIPVKITLTNAHDVDLLSVVGVNARVRIPLRQDFTPLAASIPNNSPITSAGIIESVTTRNIYSALGQRVEHVFVEVGDEVTAGQILAVLDTEELEFAIEQQRVGLALARQGNETAVSDAQRMLDLAERNLANNTNVMVLHAEAALSAANANLTEARRSHEIALQDYEDGNDMLIVSAEEAVQHAESALQLAETALENTRADILVLEEMHERLLIMYEAGFLAREELRQSESTITAAKNHYNDLQTAYNNAQIAYTNATTAHGRSFIQQSRSLEHIEIMIESAENARRIAQILLNAERAAAQQEVELLRSAVANAEAATSVEQMEIALRQLERQLENSTITAPISGTITTVNIRQGSLASGLLFTIEDTDNLRIVTSFREYDISKITVGTEVIITSDGTGNAQHTGVINRISPAAVPHSSVVEFETEVLITSENSGLRLGMTTRIDIIFEAEVTQ